MTDWFTSDLHFGHTKHEDRNIVAFSDRKIVTSREEHDEWLVELWNRQVGKNDTVYHLGDFCFTSSLDHLANLIARLNGHKVFVLGNHDDSRLWKKVKQHRQTDARLGSIAKIDKWVFKHFQHEDKKIAVMMCHFPMAAWWSQQHGAYMLHGHSHGSYEAQGKVLDVGLDSAYNHFGTHQFFSFEEVHALLWWKEVYLTDYHGKAD